jgi:threonine dehydratase
METGFQRNYDSGQGMKSPYNLPISMDQIREAQVRIAPYIRRTPLLPSTLFESLNARISFKLENLQTTGSFKLRGATNKILSLTEAEKERGVITVSSGNHGRAVSYAANRLGIRAVICLSEAVPENKVEAIQRLGAEVVIHGATYDEAEIHTLHLQEQQGLIMVDPFDDPDIIAGQGTIGLEILEDCPDVDTVIVPLSGGGLISGIALALKYTRPEIRLIGVTMDRGAAMVESLKAGKVVEIIEEASLADALIGGIGQNNRYTFNIVKSLVDETILVSENEIAHGMCVALHKENLITEGGGVVGLSAILSRKVKELGENVVVVISGGNVEIPLLYQIYQDQIRHIR